MPHRPFLQILILGTMLGMLMAVVHAAGAAECMVGVDKLKDALKASVKPSGGPSNGGLDNNEWGAVVARDGTICALAYTGNTLTDQWPASRAIAAEKANTANGVSLPNFAISTAELYAQSQPGGYLYGALTSDPPDPSVLYAGNTASWGTPADPWLNKNLGGVIVFGGGLALYDQSGIIGALGVSGDTSCADHNVAWRVRHALGLDKVPGGPSPNHNDAIIYDIGSNGKSASGFGHPTCGGKEAQIAAQIGSGVAPNPQHAAAQR
jgi:uncharacterized protein GlcG (DUF336 family)